MSDSITFPIKIKCKTVAYLRGRVLDIRRRSSGFLRLGGGSVAIAQETLRLGRKATYIHVTNEDTGEMFAISRADFDKHSFPLQSAGYEKQHACPIRFFARTSPEAVNFPIPVERQKTKQAKQMMLLGWPDIGSM